MNAQTSLDPQREQTLGGAYALSAYLLWGVLPLYFLLLVPMGPWEVVGWRVILSLAFCVLLLAVTRSWRRIAAIMRNPRLMALTAVAGLLIYVNWQAFLLGTLSGHVVETSLGYFINPIFTVLLGVLVLHERLRPLQWAAVILAAAAVVVIIVGYGAVPWIALVLTASFGFYGLVKKSVGPSVDAVSGLTLESMWLVPIALVQLSIVATTTGLVIGTVSVWHTLLVAAVGIATATPLLLFAAGARRVPLSVVGLLQFAAPILQFVIGVWVLHEPMPTGRWIGFGIVWISLILLTVDSLRAARRRQAAPPLPQ